MALASNIFLPFEACEADKVEEILSQLGNESSDGRKILDANAIVETLRSALISAHDLIPSRSFRGRALELIGMSLNKVFIGEGGSSGGSSKRNAACALVLCRQLLGDAAAVGEIIVTLLCVVVAIN